MARAVASGWRPREGGSGGNTAMGGGHGYGGRGGTVGHGDGSSRLGLGRFGEQSRGTKKKIGTSDGR